MILDASVVVKWFITDEELVDQAVFLREGVIRQDLDAIAPIVLWPEVAHAMVRAMRRSRLATDELPLLSDAVLGLQPLVAIHETPFDSVLEIASRLGINGYDAHYLALGETTGHALVSADRPLVERGREAGFDIVWLGDVPLA
jgi:predicted nucleic acid-binding protein